MNELNMQPKDYFTLTVAIVSLLLSLSTFRFNRRVKIVELKANYLDKVSALQHTQKHCRLQHDRMVQMARGRNDQGALAELDRIDLSELEEAIRSVYDDFASLSNGSSLSVYEKSFHRVNDLARRSEGVAKLIDEMYLQQAKMEHARERGA